MGNIARFGMWATLWAKPCRAFKVPSIGAGHLTEEGKESEASSCLFIGSLSVFALATVRIATAECKGSAMYCLPSKTIDFPGHGGQGGERGEPRNAGAGARDRSRSLIQNAVRACRWENLWPVSLAILSSA
jgi:hypothetical protein